MSVRVRYAPSPTGLQHIGGVRTALFNYYYARANGGAFILRVEDTDRQRYQPESLDDLCLTLDWLGIKCDEGPQTGGDYGPYTQSQRLDIYARYGRRLLENGCAYRCFCTPERLEALRKQQKEAGAAKIGYDRHCRSLSIAEAATRAGGGEPFVLRLAVAESGETRFTDHLIGEIVTPNHDITADPVLLKTDGYPTYHFANVIDDHLMKISHIMRAQEWLPSGALHIQLYRAFGWQPPVYCHLPMVMGEDNRKLSKRHGATAIRDIRAAGYLVEAVINAISLIGWSYDGSRELFTRRELEQLFTLDKLNKAPGVFDYKKLAWYNGHYIKNIDSDELCRRLLPYLQQEGIVARPASNGERQMLAKALPLLRERLKLLSDVAQQSRFLFQDIRDYPVTTFKHKKFSYQNSLDSLLRLSEQQSLLYRKETEADKQLRRLAVEMSIPLGQLLMPLRVAVTGSQVSPPLLPSIALLSKQCVAERIAYAIDLLQKEQVL